VISSLLGFFQSVASQLLQERQAAAERKRDVLLGLIIGGTVVTLLVSGFGVVVVARSVTKPMADLAAAAVEIGTTGYAAFPDSGRRDEVGVLSRSMDEMQRRLAPAERLAAMTRMATSIAHDLRTPLLGIEQGLQGLRYVTDSQLNPEARRLLGDLHTGARLAVGIVQDILDLYRQAYGELPLSFSRFTLDDLAQEAVELLGAEVRDRRLSVSVQGYAPAVWADRRRLFRVLINLLDNAIKNSPAEGHVYVVIADHGEGPSRRAVVAVEDEGSGLDPTTLDDLFEPSRPVSAPTRGGTGLGLYLCRLVIGAHQGTINAQNRPEGGARFAFDIPVENNSWPSDS
jgi:signal transduction histidine kinase